MQERKIYIETPPTTVPNDSKEYIVILKSESSQFTTKGFYLAMEWHISDVFKEFEIIAWLKPTTVNELLEDRLFSVDDKLPAKGINVLFYIANSASYFTGYINQYGKWKIATGQDMHGVTHWQPLPKNPVSKT